MRMENNCELTILMPCLNEARTLGICINKAARFLEENHVDGEILIADNGSTDGSQAIAETAGARVIDVKVRGYGSALIAGCEAARGKYVIMGDSDDSYNFLKLMPFLEKLRNGYDLVMGNRFAGGIEKGAMPWLHRYIGNPFLSFVGRLFFNSDIHDFHCGLRGYRTESIRALGLHTTGMEYASEMVVMASLYNLEITEVPTTLSKDGRDRKPHLRSFRDGWRHLKFLFMYAPSWLYLYPGLFLIIVGAVWSLLLIFGNFRIGGITFSINTLLYCMIAITIGIDAVLLYMTTKIYAYTSHYLPYDYARKPMSVKEDVMILGGGAAAAAGLIISIAATVIWSRTGYSTLEPEQFMRITIPGAFLMANGLQFVFSGFLIGILKIDSGKVQETAFADKTSSSLKPTYGEVYAEKVRKMMPYYLIVTDHLASGEMAFAIREYLNSFNQNLLVVGYCGRKYNLWRKWLKVFLFLYGLNDSWIHYQVRGVSYFLKDADAIIPLIRYHESYTAGLISEADCPLYLREGDPFSPENARIYRYGSKKYDLADLLDRNSGESGRSSK